VKDRNVTFESKRMLESKIEELKKDKEKANRILREGLKKLRQNSSGMKRTKKNLKMSENIYYEIKDFNKKTKQPMWRILEIIIESSDVGLEQKEKHKEPDICPECGSSDLLIQSGNHSWYCYGCDTSGNY